MPDSFSRPINGDDKFTREELLDKYRYLMWEKRFYESERRRAVVIWCVFVGLFAFVSGMVVEGVMFP